MMSRYFPLNFVLIVIVSAFYLSLLLLYAPKGLGLYDNDIDCEKLSVLTVNYPEKEVYRSPYRKLSLYHWIIS